MEQDTPGDTQDGPVSPPPVSPPVQTGARPHKPDLPPEEKAPEELTPEELRLMADTMPGEGPGDD